MMIYVAIYSEIFCLFYLIVSLPALPLFLSTTSFEKEMNPTSQPG